MIILGVDPGTLCTGFGIIKYVKNEFVYLHSGVIRQPAQIELPQRLKFIYQELIDIILKYQPDEFSIETAFYGENIQSALKIGQARGVSVLAAMNNNIPVKEYSPREIKKAVTGNGAASKEQVQYMIKTMLNLPKTKMKPDESDAVAIAICHGLKLKSFTSKSSSWKSFIEANPGRVIS